MDTIEFVSLPNAPTIPGLRFRRWHDSGDYQSHSSTYHLVYTIARSYCAIVEETQ